MGKIVNFALVLVTLIGARPTFAQEPNRDKLTVYGKVRVFAKADRATITFTIKGEGKDLSAAFEQANDRVDAVARKLRMIGLSDDVLSTSFFRSEENFGDKAFLSSKKDFKATMTATITTDSLSLLKAVVIVLSESEIERIDDISFALIDYPSIRKEALAKAIAKATEKAELICTQLDLERGKVIDIEEIRADAPEWPSVPLFKRRDSYNPFNAPMLFGGDRAAGGGIYAQEIQFDAEVRLIFALK